MAEERALAVVTCTAPVNIAVIKYCESRRPAGGWRRLSRRPGRSLGAAEPPGAGAGPGGAETPGTGCGDGAWTCPGWERAEMP